MWQDIQVVRAKLMKSGKTSDGAEVYIETFIGWLILKKLPQEKNHVQLNHIFTNCAGCAKLYRSYHRCCFTF
jgi:hypothetical protein